MPVAKLKIEAPAIVGEDLKESLTALVEIAKESPEKAALLAREIRAVGNITREASREETLNGLSAKSDYEALHRTMTSTVPNVVELSFESDQNAETEKAQHEWDNHVLAEARARGVGAKSRILTFEGPPLTSPQVEKMLGLTRTGLLERRKRGIILALHAGKHGYLYPKWQFGNGEYGLLPGMVDVLRALSGLDPWARAVFLLKKHPSVQWQSPLELLRRGEREKATILAKAATGRSKN